MRSLITRVKKLLPDPQLISLRNYFRGMRSDDGPPKELIMVQCVEDPYYFGLFGQIATSLRKKKPIMVEHCVLRSLCLGESGSVAFFIKSRLLTNPLLSMKWMRLYSSFCNGVAYRSVSIRPIADWADYARARRSWSDLKDKDALIQMQIDGVAVGDLINDSYLRFKPAPTVDLRDRYLLILIWQAYRDVRRAKEYLAVAKPKLYLTSYSTYIQHGVTARVALKQGVPVFSFGNYQEFAKKLSLEDWVHTKNPDQYAKEFAELARQEEKLAIAEAALSTRLSGGVDSATAYMKKSAYEETGEPVPDVRGAVIIFLHDFYDSPHAYREMVFPDFWEWICFTIETLRNENIRFFIKPHPNQISLSDKVLEELKRRYEDLPMISASVTNKQLAEAGMSCAVTVHGTVAHELAYLGVPTIACGHHPHVSFGFCRTARNRNEYSALLRESTCLQVDKIKMRRESLVFYYMHNLNIDDEMKTLNHAATQFRLSCEKNGTQHEAVFRLKQITLQKAYFSVIDQMIM